MSAERDSTLGALPRCGRVGLVGRPNAGKSTLLNRILGEKLAIVSDKPQTTRHRLVGIHTEKRGQMILLDTPGVHKPLHRLNRRMVKAATGVLAEVEVVCLLVDTTVAFGGGDRYMLDLLSKISVPRILALNKIDLVAKRRLLPLIEIYHESGLFEEIVPISAATGDGVELLLDQLWERLPTAEPLYDRDTLTVHPLRFLVAERIREKLLEETRDELPFSTAVLIDEWDDGDDNGLLRLRASIIVERESQKRIVIGKGGRMIKTVGTAARHDLEPFLERRIYLDLRVRCEPGWREKRSVLGRLDQELLLLAVEGPSQGPPPSARSDSTDST